MSLLQCYNKGCGVKYDPEDNAPESCKYHPGEPIFHDAKKSWSCCKKYSTDFSEFLNIKGCAVGMHNNTRLLEPKTIEPSTNAPIEVEKREESISSPEPLSPEQSTRPTDLGALHTLSVQISPSLTDALAKQTANPESENSAGDAVSKTNGDHPTAGVEIGTKCKNPGCSTFFTYDDERTSGTCSYHPGVAVFHEGMKYWSCCRNLTSDFEVFEKQPGCCYGRHVWKEPVSSEPSKNVSCRYDWFQFSKDITISIYAKLVRPDTLSVTADKMSVTASFQFGIAEPQVYSQTIHLFGVIDPLSSHVKASPTKLEIVLRKAETKSWSRLEEEPPKPIITYHNLSDVENREEHCCWRPDSE